MIKYVRKKQGVENACSEMNGLSGSPNNTQSNRRRDHHVILL